MTETTKPEALITEYRETMPAGVLHLWAKDATEELRRQHAEIERLRAELAEMKTPDMFWLNDDPEQGCCDLQSIAAADYADDNGSVRAVDCAKSLPQFRIRILIDADGNAGYEVIDAAKESTK